MLKNLYLSVGDFYRKHFGRVALDNLDLLMLRYISEGEPVRAAVKYSRNLATLQIGESLTYFLCDNGEWIPTIQSDWANRFVELAERKDLGNTLK